MLLIQSKPVPCRSSFILASLMTLLVCLSAGSQVTAAQSTAAQSTAAQNAVAQVTTPETTAAKSQGLQAQLASAMRERMRACTACHGKEGVATNQGYFPRIAGKPADYLYNQLRNFREGRRQNPAMRHLLEHMSDDYLRQMARYFSELDLPYPAPQPTSAPPALLARGEQLVMQGDRQAEFPACTACHGAAMTGRLPSTPGLLGLPTDYVVAQLGAWRAGTRKAEAPDCMAQVARRLSREDIHAVSQWLAAQPVPERGHPAAPGRQTTGIRCKDDPK